MRLLSTRRLLVLLIIVTCRLIYIYYKHKSMAIEPKIPQILPSNSIKSLLKQFFTPGITLKEIQNCWNRLMSAWEKVLMKFLTDGCQHCHHDIYNKCYTSIDLQLYIFSLNRSFYPYDERIRPNGIGLYYNFNLELIRSGNHSILSTNVNICDYFRMIQLLMHVQSILHRLNIGYFITKGTFIGSLRHHDIIPWDADIDFFISQSSAFKLKRAFQQMNRFIDSDNGETFANINENVDLNQKVYSSEPLYQQDLFVHQFQNTRRVTSYKVFSIHSTRVEGTYYRWPKIDIFPYQQSRTHVFAHPRQDHNLGTMKYLAKTDIEPYHLRLLGPLLLPSPRHIHPTLKAMIRSGKSDVFNVCEGNKFLHRENRATTDLRRVPCYTLTSHYPFVKSGYNSSSNLCSEAVVFKEKTHSLFLYECKESLRRTLD
ncbi:unnamed protein product [Adineta ricciae]|uniref:LicD/FKTN/FKRP nucleotidyltransferase domain-containing protein n=1 Tax=Adineta ricciae TaxID=249248 RepID=A0A814PRY8_ADIRI|nr:unnamed protein product [Adineta ricciae]CAF1492716.1 unnamed protein product [Adineta ricciae]